MFIARYEWNPVILAVSEYSGTIAKFMRKRYVALEVHPVFENWIHFFQSLEMNKVLWNYIYGGEKLADVHPEMTSFQCVYL